MVKRSLTNNIVIKKKKSPKKITKSPISDKYNDYISKNKNEKKNEMNMIVDKLSTENIKEIILSKTEGPITESKINNFKKNPNNYITLDELKNFNFNEKKVNIFKESKKFKKIIKSPKSKKSKQKDPKDINLIEENIKQLKTTKLNENKNLQKPSPKKQDPKASPKKQYPKPSPKKQDPKASPKKQYHKPSPKQTKSPKTKKQTKLSPKKSSPKQIKPSHIKRTNKKSLNNLEKKKIEDKIKLLEKKLDEIEKKDDKNIKNELKKQGFKTKGKTPKRLRDIYLLAQNEFNIKHE